jgi:hypothetical protein
MPLGQSWEDGFYSPEPMPVGGLVFNAGFDSGNLGSVSAVDGGAANSFELRLSPDCARTPFETTHRAWFHFSVAGAAAGTTVRMTIMNMAKLYKLFGRGGMQPWVRRASAHPLTGWALLPRRVACEAGDEGMELAMVHEFDGPEPVFFGFCVPYPWALGRAVLDEIDARFAETTTTDAAAAAAEGGTGAGVGAAAIGTDRGYGPHVLLPLGGDDEARRRQVHYRREILCRSLKGRPMDLVTITAAAGAAVAAGTAAGAAGTVDEASAAASAAARAKLYATPGLFDSLAPSKSVTDLHRAAADDDGAAGSAAAKAFPGRPVVLLSARVHPGETPASYLLDGALRFLLDAEDPAAEALRQRFVFKIVPFLNPDGVALGHYRQDTRGRNLNRCYGRAESALVGCTPSAPATAAAAAGADGGAALGLGGSLFGGKGGFMAGMAEPSGAAAGRKGGGTGGGKGGGKGGKGDGSGSDGEDGDDEDGAADLAPTPEIFAMRTLAKAAADFAFTTRLARQPAAAMAPDGATAKPPARRPPREAREGGGGLYAFIDLHAHASKKGIFVFGNHHFGVEERVQCRLLPYLLERRTALFEFGASGFSINNMVKKDKRGEGKEGCSRVMIAKDTGCVRVFTLESNYNTTLRSRLEGSAAPAAGRQYTTDDWLEVGLQAMWALLDTKGWVGDGGGADGSGEQLRLAKVALRKVICGRRGGEGSGGGARAAARSSGGSGSGSRSSGAGGGGSSSSSSSWGAAAGAAAAAAVAARGTPEGGPPGNNGSDGECSAAAAASSSLFGVAAKPEKGSFRYEVVGRMVIVRSGLSLESARRCGEDGSGAEVGSVYRRGEQLAATERWEMADGTVRVLLAPSCGGGYISERSGKGVPLIERLGRGNDQNARTQG